jgi:TRAP-type uncharacterized transport system substrate-binding protein
LSLIETPSVWASAQALKEQKVDAAVVRSDDPAAADGRTIFVLRNIYAALLVPAQASVDGISKLKGKKIGVLTDDVGIDPMAKVVLNFYGFDKKHIVRLGLKDLPVSLQHRQVAALLVVGPTGAGAIADAIEAFRKSTKKPPKFLDLAEATAIAERFAVYDEAEISVGAFSGSPAVPSDKVVTISANVLLVARASLSNYAAGEITRLLLATKTRVAATLPDVGQLAAPSTDKDDLLPAHPGTVAFLNGDQTSLLDESINWILLGSMLTGFLGSLAAWLNRLRNKTKGDELKGQGSSARLPMLQAQARASGPEQLDATEKELEPLSHGERRQQQLGEAESFRLYDMDEKFVSGLRASVVPGRHRPISFLPTRSTRAMGDGERSPSSGSKDRDPVRQSRLRSNAAAQRFWNVTRSMTTPRGVHGAADRSRWRVLSLTAPLRTRSFASRTR